MGAPDWSLNSPTTSPVHTHILSLMKSPVWQCGQFQAWDWHGHSHVGSRQSVLFPASLPCVPALSMSGKHIVKASIPPRAILQDHPGEER